MISINYTQKGNGKTVKPDYSDFGRKVLVARLRAIAADQAALAYFEIQPMSDGQGKSGKSGQNEMQGVMQMKAIVEMQTGFGSQSE